MLCRILYQLSILIFGTLYPTYLSYKALKRKDDQECARMMMYWVVFAIFTFAEGFLDIFVGLWLPFYYESKMIFIYWLISPYGNGARFLYENYVREKFEQNEQVIDEFISSLKQFSIDVVWKIWDRFSVYFNYLLVVFFQKAQIFLVQYMHNQNAVFNKNPFSSALLNASSSSNAIEFDPGESTSCESDTMDINEIKKEDETETKPSRKNKRNAARYERNLLDSPDGDVEPNRRITRLAALKIKSRDTETHSAYISEIFNVNNNDDK